MHTHTHTAFLPVSAKILIFAVVPILCQLKKKKNTSLIKIKMFHSANHEILEAYTLFLNFLN